MDLKELDSGKGPGEILQPKYARIKRTVWKYGPGKDPAKDPPDEVLERVEWRELQTNRLLSPPEAELKEAELRAKGEHPDALDERLRNVSSPSDGRRIRNPLQ